MPQDCRQLGRITTFEKGFRRQWLESQISNDPSLHSDVSTRPDLQDSCKDYSCSDEEATAHLLRGWCSTGQEERIIVAHSFASICLSWLAKCVRAEHACHSGPGREHTREYKKGAGQETSSRDMFPVTCFLGLDYTFHGPTTSYSLF